MGMWVNMFIYFFVNDNNEYKLGTLDCESSFLFGASINSSMASAEKRGHGSFKFSLSKLNVNIYF